MSKNRNAIALAYIDAFQRNGPAHYIDNLFTRVESCDWGAHHLPLTVNDGTGGATFVCDPRVGWIDFTREELAHFPNRWLVPPLHLVLSILAPLLSLAQVSRIVHVNNWMMSTNLLPALDVRLTKPVTHALCARFPGHVLAFRSLTRRHSGKLMEALDCAGWIFLPARQVFVVDDVASENLTRRDARNDARLWGKMSLRYDELTEVTPEDATRIAALYAQLYRGKYSKLNPDYTAAFVQMSAATGLLRYLVLRDAAGVIQAVGGMQHAGLDATMPLLGYNLESGRSLGLYRLICHAGSLYCARRGLRYNMSSGATGYKRTRGATSEMEYTAFYIKHLPRLRRAPFALMSQVGRHIAEPLLRKYAL